MPKQKARSAAKPAAEPEASRVSEEPSATPGTEKQEDVPGKDEKTFGAASGKSFAIAHHEYPSTEEMAPEFAKEVVTASNGDLIDVFLLDGDFGYGKRFRSKPPPAVNEGVFRLEWVHGVKLSMVDGKRRPLEVDIRSSEYGLRLPKPTDTASKLRAKRHRKKLEDADQLWRRLNEQAERNGDQDASVAQEAAELLEKEDANEKKRKEKAAARRAKRKAKDKVEAQSSAAAAANVKERDAVENDEGQPLDDADAEADTRDDPGHVAPADIQRDEVAAASESSPNEEAMATFAFGSSQLQSRRRSQASERKRPHQKQMAWDAQWEQEALHLESVLSASSSGDERGRRRPTVQKRIMTRKFAKGMLEAKRSGELHAIAEEWEKAHEELANKASDLSAFYGQAKQEVLNAHKEGDLTRIAEVMAIEAESKAKEVKALKERVFKAMIDMRRSRKLERSTSDMDDAQKELEMKAIQLKRMMKAWKGMQEAKRPKEASSESEGPADSMCQSKRPKELQRIADEMAEHLQTKAESIKKKLRNGLLRAHRAGELLEIRDELDEIADSVDTSMKPPSPPAKPEIRKRWGDFSSDSDSGYNAKEVIARRCLSPKPTNRRIDDVAQGDADISGSEGESSFGMLSPGK